MLRKAKIILFRHRSSPDSGNHNTFRSTKIISDIAVFPLENHLIFEMIE